MAVSTLAAGRMATLALAIAMALTGCRETAEAPVLEPVGEARVALERAACEDRGGRFQPAGKSKSLVCFTTPKDAGQRCTKADDCESACLARSNSCSPIQPLFGCQDILNSGGQRVTQCID